MPERQIVQQKELYTMKSKRSSAHARVFLGTLLVLTLLGFSATSQAQTIAGGQIVGVLVFVKPMWRSKKRWA